MFKKYLLFALALIGLGGVPALAQQYRDPIAYCQAVGTINRPDARYVGPKLPRWMARSLNLQPNQGSMMEWRCADRAVLACVYGANIPCGSIANTNQTPTPAISDYCRNNKNASFIPMVVTGHETAVTWACQGKSQGLCLRARRVLKSTRGPTRSKPLRTAAWCSTATCAA